MPPQSHHRDSGTTYFQTLCNLIWWVLNLLEWRVLIGCSWTHTTGILWDILLSSKIPDFWVPLSLLVCLTNAWKRTEETEGDLLPLQLYQPDPIRAHSGPALFHMDSLKAWYFALFFREKNPSVTFLCLMFFLKKFKYLTETVFLYIYTSFCKSQSHRNLSCALVFVPVFVFESGESVNLDVVGSVYVNVDEPYCASRREAGSHQEQQRAPSPIVTTKTTSTTTNNTNNNTNNNTRSNNGHQAQL